MTVRFVNINATTEPFFLKPGSYFLTYSSDWGGGGVTLQWQTEAGTWIDVFGTWQADSENVHDLAGMHRLVVSGGATNVNVAILTRTLY